MDAQMRQGGAAAVEWQGVLYRSYVFPCSSLRSNHEFSPVTIFNLFSFGQKLTCFVWFCGQI